MPRSLYAGALLALAVVAIPGTALAAGAPAGAQIATPRR